MRRGSGSPVRKEGWHIRIGGTICYLWRISTKVSLNLYGRERKVI